MIVDLGLLERAMMEARDALDHRFLDEMNDLGPATMENLSAWIWRKVEPVCSGLFRVTVYRDSSGEACSYFGPEEIAMQPEGALVLFSGGQDSTTCLAWALERFQRVETVGFHYGQRHAVELDCRPTILERFRTLRSEWAERLGSDHMLPLDVLGSISETALTRDLAIAELD